MKYPALLPYALCCIAVATSCKDGGAPELTDPGDQVAVVGMQLQVHLYASDPEGDSIDFSFSSSAPDLSSTAAMTIAPDGHGVFAFTPLASQLGDHPFDFTASDGKNDTTITINIEVTGAFGDGTLPIFRKPLGTGTVLDLEQAECVEFDVAIEDQDSTTITLDQLPPLIQDAELAADASGLMGRWTWCPNREQIEGDDRYDLTLSAQDAPENQPTLKPYVIVLRRRSGSDCPGGAPELEHAPMDAETLLDIPVEVQISDDVGLKDAPILLYAYEDPGDPIDFTKLTVVDMQLTSGDMMNGAWLGYIPNPVANTPDGESDIWYLVTATDNDDTEGDCDHLSDSPDTGTHRMHVVNNGMGNAGLCGHCSFDVQCGSFSNLCLPQEAGNFCGLGCQDDSECEEGYTCSPTDVQSVEGNAARQCIPDSGSCVEDTGSGGPCTEDDAEENDDIEQASTLAPLDLATDYQASLCDDNSDWFPFTLSSAGQISASLDGPDGIDIDLFLTDGEGFFIEPAGTGLTADEFVTTACVDAGDYYIRMFAPSSTTTGDYSFRIDVETASCGGGGTFEGDCCEAKDTPGCEDETVTDCVCGMDDFCCDNKWDSTCVTLAKSECGLECGDVPVDHDCCATGTAGCDDPTVEACVCADDAFCCSNSWDSMCVAKVGSLLCAPSCDPDDNDGPCCTEHAGGGCEVNAVEMCVCENDELCCAGGWDNICVEEIEDFMCGNCP
jgi:hypothetical protein